MNTTGNIIELNSSHEKFSQVLDLDREQFPRPWRAEEWQGLNWSHHLLIGQLSGDEVEAFALIGLVPGDDVAHLLKICVKTSLRGKGVAPQFWQNCLPVLRSKAAKSVFLEVEASNQRAISFYHKQGFVTLRVIKGYYSDGESAITMLATL